LFRWRDDTAGILLAGWLALARCGGALPKRYHVWITGSSDTGKTEVMEKLVRFCLGENGHAYFKGSTTEAGVRQEVAGATRPVVFDELESDGPQSIERVSAIVELLRTAYDGGKIVKGSPSGVVHEFVACFPAVVSSIRMALDNDADRSRFLQVELKSLLPDQQERAVHYSALLNAIDQLHKVDHFAERLFLRTLKNIDVILDNYRRIRTVFSSLCQKSRTVSMYSIMVAGHYSLMSDSVISDSAIQDYADGLDFGERPETDENLCLGHLLATKLRVIDSRAKGMNDAIVYEEHTVGHLAELAANGTELTPDQKKALEMFGAKIYKNHLCISKNSANIKTRFQSSKWSKSFADVLMRVADKSNMTLRFNGKMDRVITISLANFKSTND
jgi:hypothetical protein